MPGRHGEWTGKFLYGLHYQLKLEKFRQYSRETSTNAQVIEI
jgi:hypothetical protein